MANFNKSFNFRGGFQVDDSVFLVRGQQVGIGSSVPTEALDVNGAIKAKGLVVTSELPVGIESANVGFLSATTINVGVASINAGVITATTPAGIVTYYGDGRFLQGLPTSQWLDVDVGLGYTSIYAAGNVGVDTVDPRYKFQVGGVPFPTTTGPALPAQNGVGIEDGAIYASGIVSTRGTVVALGTVYTETEFIGVGSNITVLNADNIAIGSIGSMRYGDIITTKEVYADRFIGTATSAETLPPDALITVDELTANRIEANDKFYSENGFLQIGVDENFATVGDLEVNKIFDDSNVYGISSTGSSRVLVGQERRTNSTIKYGGIQKGITPGNASGPEDLDLINFDIGNLNFYLHGGNSGTTAGNFRWINGQSSSILAELTPESNFRINGSVVNNDPTLEVNGTTKLAGLTVIDDTLVVTGISSLNSITIEDTLEVTGDATFNGAINLLGSIGISSLLIGSDPTLGGSGTLITETTAFLAGTFEVTSSTVNSANNINAPTFVGDLSAGTAIFTSELSNSANSFIVDSSGAIQGESISVSSGTIDSISGDSINVTGTVSGQDVSATGSVSGGSGTFDNLSAVTDFSSPSALIGSISATTVSATNSITTNDLTVTGSTSLAGIELSNLTVDTITSDSSSIGMDVDLEMASNDITANNISCNLMDANEYSTSLAGATIEFRPNESTPGVVESLTLTVTLSGVSYDVKLPIGTLTTDSDGGTNDELYLSIIT